MALVTFQDLPSTNTPINATNLNKIQEGNVYSTNEVEIGVFNNKKYYRKAFITTDPLPNYQSASNMLVIPHGISNVDTIDIEKAYMYNSVGTSIPIAYSAMPQYPTDTSRGGVDANKTEIRAICLGGGWGNTWTKVFVVNYTKTTD